MITRDRLEFEEGDTAIEIRGIFDGWSILHKKDGTMINRWMPEDRRHAAVEEWMDNYRASNAVGAEE